MKKCILTAYDNNIAGCTNLSEIINNKKEYSRKYIWDFICETDENFDKSKPAAFSKIKFIIDCLNKYDLVFWNDMDCIFTNFTIDISNALKNDEYIGVLEERIDYFCTGNILIKSNDYTKNFFSSLKNIRSWNENTHPWEQKTFNEKLLLTKYEHLKKFKSNEFGAFQQNSPSIILRRWQQGDFILHISGGPKQTPWQQRIDSFIKRYKKHIIYT